MPPAPVTRPTASEIESDDDIFDDDDDYEVPQEEEKIYSVQELSKILREDKKGCAETDKVYESIQNMKSRSLKRYGSTRPPPRQSVKVRRYLTYSCHTLHIKCTSGSCFKPIQITAFKNVDLFNRMQIGICVML